jgi:hypothetical protein
MKASPSDTLLDSTSFLAFVEATAETGAALLTDACGLGESELIRSRG